MNKEIKVEDKYRYYETSVQNPSGELETLNKIYKKIVGRKPKTLREDFCGTGWLACEWVKQGSDYVAYGFDLDPEPVEYGKKHHLAKLKPDQQQRVHYRLENVLKGMKEKVDLTVAFNFSYYIFKQREELVNYFKAVRKTLSKDGLFMMDLFGGPESIQLVIEETEHDDFSYFWDCQKFNPITNECLFAIHFKPNGKKMYRDVFTYDWRMWGLPELRDILKDAGFSKTFAFWEGDDGEGGGNGEFYQTELAEQCEAWVTYIAARP